MARKILFTGYYGFNNFGDDLFGLACVEGLQEIDNDFVPVILAPPVNGIKAEYAVPAILAGWYKNQSVTGKLLRALFMVYGCLRYSDVVLSGGSVISSGSSFRMRKIQYFFAKAGVCRISAIGVSVGPFTSEKDRNDAKQFINCFSYLTVRDEASIKECQSMGLNVKAHLYNDLAGCAPLPTANKSEIKKKNLGVSVCRYESLAGGDTEKEHLRNMAIFEGISNFAIKHDVKVRILILNANETVGDIEISKKLSDYLSENGISVEIIDYVNPVQSLKDISSSDLFFSVRLHGAISAYLLEVPFLLVEYHEKCKDFLDYIGFDKENRILASVADKVHVSECLESISDSSKNFSVVPSAYIETSNKTFTESPWSK
jgi:polysaccharide pyruvyl transferase WcaK-like protein